MSITKLNLTVQKLENSCYFELSWGEGQQIGVTVPYPHTLDLRYEEWQRTYLNFYHTQLRGRVEESGSLVAPPVDWRARLVQAEARFLHEFHNWLRRAELHEIRTTIYKTREADIFLTCNCLELQRLPWEVWEVAEEFTVESSRFRIARTPINCREPIANQQKLPRKARILVILGDESHLNFTKEKQALASLRSRANVTFVGLQAQENKAELKHKIVEAIASAPGWDILFFAGHSNETDLIGGELGIAPHTSLFLSEITPALIKAKNRGLQVAIFNSCQGLSIANKLIDLGITQVAVMREPIHNRVAEDFLLQFIKALASDQDVHTSLLTASQYLKLEKNLTYPSAYLIPSFFRRPEADLFRLQPSGIKQFSAALKPSRTEVIVLLCILIISLILPLQKWLLGRRILAQAIYRQLTNQVATVPQPPVLLVEIDDESIRKAKIPHPKPMNREYLARLVDRLVDQLATNNPRVIGIDYLLDRPQEERDPILAKSIQNGISAPQPIWFVLAATQNRGKWLLPLPNIASVNWSLQGNIQVRPGYMELLPRERQDHLWSFSSLLAVSYELQKIPNTPQPKLESKTNFWQQINTFLEDKSNRNSTILSFERWQLQPITALSYWLNQIWMHPSLDQMWMHPIIDFSIPVEEVYSSIPAWELLESSKSPPRLQQQVVIIAPGGYHEAGIIRDGEDNFTQDLPLAVEYWRSQKNPHHDNQVITGGEIHAYMVHHLLTRRLVIPIPDFWVIAITIPLGKTLSFFFNQHREYRYQSLIIPTALMGIYGLIVLQMYISTALLLPWFLPSAMVWVYFTGCLKSDD